MASRLLTRVLLPMLVPAAVCAAQGYIPPPLTVNPCTTAPNPNIPQDPKAKPPVCPPPAPPAPAKAAPATPDAEKPAAEKFPYPGDAPPAQQPSAAQQFPYPGDAPKLPAAHTPNAPANGKSAADQFPYPGETKDSPGATPEGATPAGSSSSSSNSDSSSSSSSSLPDDVPSDVPDTGGRHKLPKISAQTPDERVTQDLQVAKFYSNVGNYQAAYLRSKDAIETLPSDAESHFRLAQAAQKLNRKDEAVAEYNKYLQLDPGGDWSQQAEKALAELR